eukprot:3515822-Pyramimonas_sp.AAC.1
MSGRFFPRATSYIFRVRVKSQHGRLPRRISPFFARNLAAQGFFAHRGAMSHPRHIQPLREAQPFNGVIAAQ